MSRRRPTIAVIGGLLGSALVGLGLAPAVSEDPPPRATPYLVTRGVPHPVVLHEPPSRAPSRGAPPLFSLARYVRRGLPLYCGGSRGRYVALTFDDGPGPYTALALRILRAAHDAATFFLVGRNLARWPWAPRAELKIGALGDHTWTHAWLPELAPAQSLEQLARTQEAVARYSGAPVQLFRPPYGARDRTIDAQARSLGMLDVLWSVDTRDSEGASWSAIAETVTRDLRPGAIILMHENRGQTIRALKFRVLPLLRSRGYTTVTVPQLLRLDPPTAAELHGRCFAPLAQTKR
jgi:peptidoglycan/xylan/chitin deacetylase (PgdA/CDA1 family)